MTEMTIPPAMSAAQIALKPPGTWRTAGDWSTSGKPTPVAARSSNAAQRGEAENDRLRP